MFEQLNGKLEEIHHEVKFTNGKVKELSAWREQIRGASNLVKSLWGLFGLIILGMTVALFTMWVEFQSIQSTIELSILEELENYKFEIIE